VLEFSVDLTDVSDNFNSVGVKSIEEFICEEVINVPVLGNNLFNTLPFGLTLGKMAKELILILRFLNQVVLTVEVLKCGFKHSVSSFG